jgi:hypothetical protein
MRLSFPWSKRGQGGEVVQPSILSLGVGKEADDPLPVSLPFFLNLGNSLAEPSMNVLTGLLPGQRGHTRRAYGAGLRGVGLRPCRRGLVPDRATRIPARCGRRGPARSGRSGRRRTRFPALAGR